MKGEFTIVFYKGDKNNTNITVNLLTYVNKSQKHYFTLLSSSFQIRIL